MRFERMVIEAGGSSLSLPMHARFTVIAGLGEAERSRICSELIDSLGPSRSGVHLELVLDNGRRLAVFRPEGGAHRVVDVDEGTDVSDEYRTDDDSAAVDLLGRHDISVSKARRAMRLTRNDLSTTAATDEVITRLATLDQTELWSAAARVRVTDEELQSAVEEAGGSAEEAAAIERIEQQHQSLEAVSRTHSRIGRQALIVAAFACVVALPVAAFNITMGALLLALGAIIGVLALVQRSRLGRAERDEFEALSAVGADSYLGFQLKRVDGLMTTEQSRKRLLESAEEHRGAAAKWGRIAGDVGVDWALEHHEQIVASARLRDDIRRLGSMSSTAPGESAETANFAQAIVGAMARARRIGRSTESFPLILDNPFTDVDPASKPSLLELLSRTAGSPQAILLTDDEDVASWARLEALAGELSILEPTTPQGETKNHSVA